MSSLRTERTTQLAAGRTADVFPHGSACVLKLFRDWVPHELGLPVPAVYDVIESAGGRGIVFEQVDGPLMLDEVRRRPWKAKRLARELADLHVRVHLQSPDGVRSRRMPPAPRADCRGDQQPALMICPVVLLARRHRQMREGANRDRTMGGRTIPYPCM